MIEQRRRKWLLVGLIALLCVALLGLTLSLGLKKYVRSQLVRAVEDRFGGKMQVTRLQVSMWPSIRIAGEGVAVRQQVEAEMPPLLAVKKFSLQADLWELLRPTRHVQEIWVEGLHVQVPPHEAGKEQDSGAKRMKLPARFVVDTSGFFSVGHVYGFGMERRGGQVGVGRAHPAENRSRRGPRPSFGRIHLPAAFWFEFHSMTSFEFETRRPSNSS
jgi:hypothetical protein